MKFASLILRIGLGLVLLYFGINQLIDPSKWTTLLPSFLGEGFIIFNGIFEIVLATFLILGLFTRVAALIFALHLILIMTQLGYGDSMARDLGLFFSTIALAFLGSDYLSLDALRKRR